jgi:hypothetical protein
MTAGGDTGDSKCIDLSPDGRRWRSPLVKGAITIDILGGGLAALAKSALVWMASLR